MSDNQIPYGLSSVTLRLEIPPQWPVADIATIDCEVRSPGGTVLESSAAATLYTADALDSATVAGARSITLGSTCDDLYEGDKLYIVASDAGGGEIVEVETYNDTTNTATLRRSMYRSHSDATDVYGMFATYDLDVSDTAVFTPGLQIVVGWTPDVGGTEITSVYTIAKDEFVGADTLGRFRVRFPDCYLAAEDTIDDIEVEATRQLRYDFRVRDLDIDRVPDQELLMPALLTQMAYIICLGRGGQWELERNMYLQRYDAECEKLFAMAIWVDDDQDQAADEDNEIRYHSPVVYTRGV
jgi:hypothetical protein